MLTLFVQCPKHREELTMTRSTRTFALIAGTGLLALALVAPTAHAQFRPVRGVQPNTFNRQAWRGATRVNPNPMIAPGVSLNQWASNTRVIGRAYSTIPPYALGYNPYPAVINTGPVFPTMSYPVYNPYMTYGYNPGLYNPYAYGYGLGTNPYLP
jgi:hypothetical protein